MSVGQSQISSISTLIEASSSEAVLLGFFIALSRRGSARLFKCLEGDQPVAAQLEDVRVQIGRFKMIRKVIGVASLAAGIIAPLAASAQGVPEALNVGPAKVSALQALSALS